MFSKFIEHYSGVVLMMIVCISSLWLAATKQLDLYIHPRYGVFTTVVATLGLLLCCAGFYYAGSTHQHDHFSHIDQKSSGWQRAKKLVAILLCVGSFFCFIVAKPTTLTSATVEQRGVNSSVTSATKPRPAIGYFGASDYRNFTIKDWAALLEQTNEAAFFTDKSAVLVGFVSPSPHDPDVFYLSRFVVTCCAVDARPIGIAIYAPQWQTNYPVNNWVQVEGSFIAHPKNPVHDKIVLKPHLIKKVSVPEEPYVY